MEKRPGRLEEWRQRISVDDLREVSSRWMAPEGWDGGLALVIAPGAGAPMDHPFVVFLQEALARRGHLVVSFNFPYQEAGRRAPDRAPVLEAAWRGVAEHVRERGPRRLVFGGKSMGGRIAAQVVAAGDSCDGLFFLGYPLHPPGRTERLRDAPLRALSQPLLFVQGERDRLCDLGLLEVILRELTAPVGLHVIPEGDHSFKVPKRSGRTEQAVWEEIALMVGEWAERL